MRQATIESFDGTRIVYRTGGTGDRWLVVANGYGGTFGAWDQIFELLADRYRLLIWDYRGLHGSGIPRDPARLRIEDHCRDLDVLREALGIERMAMAGWSIGVQVALEQYRRTPGAIDALALINGTHGRVLARSTASALARRMLPGALRGLRALAPVLSPGVLPPLRAMAARRWSPALMRRAGVFNGDAPSLGDAMRAVLTLDYRIYTAMILLADQHDTDDLLPRITVPTVVVGGDRDAITPPPLSRRTAARIPGCHYRQVRGATHYGLMEFPELYAAHIAEVLDASAP